MPEGVEDREVKQELIELGMYYVQRDHIGYPTAPDVLENPCSTYLEPAVSVIAY